MKSQLYFKDLGNSRLHSSLKILFQQKIRNLMRAVCNEVNRAYEFYVVLDVAHCNLKCSMCPRGGVEGLEGPGAGLMDFALFKKIVDRFSDEGVKIGCLELGFWGEPLLNPALPEMIRYARSNLKPGWGGKEAVIDLNTNLNLLPDPIGLLNSGVTNIRFSISGMVQDTYSINHRGGEIKLVLDNILKLVKIRNSEKLKNITLEMRFHDYIYNKKDAELAKKFCNKHGLVFNHMRIYIPSIESNIKFKENKDWEDFYSRFIDIKREKASMIILNKERIKDCRLRRNRVTINFDGQIYRCCGVFEKKYLMGSFFTHKVKDIPGLPSEICEECAQTPISWR